MTGYNCKYAPIEILAGFGEQYELMNGEVENFDYASGRMHQNMCSHAKAMLENIHSGEYDSLLFMNCCDSSRRVFDSLKNESLAFSYCIDLPSCGTVCAVEKFKDDLLEFIGEYEKFSGKSFNKKRFLSSFKSGREKPKGKFVAVIGARCGKTLIDAAKACFGETEIFDLTCASGREVFISDADENDSMDEIMLKYAKALISQTPCMRMQNIKAREALLEDENCIGIIYSTVKFCDYYDFEFSKLKGLKTPIIRIESDYTNQSYGQLLTRIEGFAETVLKPANKKTDAKRPGKYFIGIDSGSTTTELVALDENLNIVSSVMVRTGANAAAGAKKALEKSGLRKNDAAFIMATGYGRKNIGFADGSITEITCHAKGARRLCADVKTIIDIGGQDSKVIVLGADGSVVNFAMNDKCAAGTGRFLENMAKVLDLDMNTMAEIGLKYKNELTVSSMCTVFAESEVVSFIADDRLVSDIVHGLNKSVAVKTKALASSVKELGTVMMTGGVANNKGVVSELEKLLNTKITVPEHPEFCGALGAAIAAAEALQK